MASVFANLVKNTAASALPTKTAEAQRWVNNTATRTMGNASAVIKSAPASSKIGSPQQPLIGSMVLFQYQATTAKDLPYWDKFPLVFPFDITSDGMYGINMHYLPIPLRAKLMDALMHIADGPMTDAKTKLQLSYQVLQSVSRNNYFAPCIKRYLNKGLASKLVVVPATEWSVALFLPLERFQKASSREVYEDSRRKIKGR
jgi:hypothetical protein